MYDWSSTSVAYTAPTIVFESIAYVLTSIIATPTTTTTITIIPTTTIYAGPPPTNFYMSIDDSGTQYNGKGLWLCNFMGINSNASTEAGPTLFNPDSAGVLRRILVQIVVSSLLVSHVRGFPGLYGPTALSRNEE